jgi:diguanylate cyclase (GGDEF)-like protein
MSDPKKTIEETLEALRVGYAAKLPEKLAALKAAADLSVADGSNDEATQAVSDLRVQAHNLAGSAGAFGFASLGEAAKKLELFCLALPNGGTPESQSDRQQITDLVQSLLQNQEISQKSDRASNLANSGNASSEEMNSNDQRNILIVDDDPVQAARFQGGLSAFGYDVRVVAGSSDLTETLRTFRPAATILDIESAGKETVGAETIEKARAAIGDECPLVVLAPHRDFDARLAAIRAGCDQFLIKPVKVDEVIPVLEKFIAPKEAPPERVLIVDDDPDILDFVKATLQSAGMIVEGFSDPASMLERMEESHWEIVIVDLHMPICSGRELASIIRQKPEYMAIPIVFLSAESDKSIQLDAMGAGADDFLTKPIIPRHLIASVQSRVDRFRAIRNMMNRDSLTSLYNHATTWQLFETELSKTLRSNAPLSFAMIDIDHFKSVNDNLGHGVGDIVLKALSKLLTHRLRSGDIIGRLGGEEFGVVLLATTAEQAYKTIDEIRRSFEKISQAAANSEKPITFSCGIAAFPELRVASEMAEAADAALYEAKESGRNRIVIAT